MWLVYGNRRMNYKSGAGEQCPAFIIHAAVINGGSREYSCRIKEKMILCILLGFGDIPRELHKESLEYNNY